MALTNLVTFKNHKIKYPVKLKTLIVLLALLLCVANFDEESLKVFHQYFPYQNSPLCQPATFSTENLHVYHSLSDSSKLLLPISFQCAFVFSLLKFSTIKYYYFEHKKPCNRTDQINNKLMYFSI